MKLAMPTYSNQYPNHATPTAPLVVRSFAAALWLISKGLEPTSGAVDPDTGALQFIFAAAARPHLYEFNAAKDRLNRLVSGDAAS
jgi:hypothetical protein